MRTPRALPVYPWGDNEIIYFGDGSDAEIYYDGSNFILTSDTGLTLEVGNDEEILCTEGGNVFLQLDHAADDTFLRGGDAAGDDLKISANSSDDYPALWLSGGSDIQYRTNRPTGTIFYYRWGEAVTSTGNILATHINAADDLTMGVNFGVTGLKIDVKAANGAGESYGIDVSGVPNTETTLKYLNTADAVTADPMTDAPNNWIKGAIGATAYYVPCYTVDGD